MTIYPIDSAATESVTNTQGDAIRIECIERHTGNGNALYRAWITWNAISFRAHIGVSADAQCFVSAPSFSHMDGMVVPAPIASESNTTATGSLTLRSTMLSPYVRIVDDASLATLRKAAETWYWAQEHAWASQRAEYAAQRRAAL